MGLSSNTKKPSENIEEFFKEKKKKVCKEFQPWDFSNSIANLSYIFHDN